MSWTKIKLSDVADFKNGFAFKSADLRDESTENSFKVFKMGHIKKGGGFNRENKTQYVPSNVLKDEEKYLVITGDILMCMTDMKTTMNLLGHSAFMPENLGFQLNQRVGLIRPKEEINGRYLYYYLNTQRYIDSLRATAVAGVQVNLSTDSIRNSIIRLPPRVVQDEIVTHVSTFEDLIENNRRRMRLLEESARLLYQEWFVHLRFPGHEQVKITDGVPERWERKPLKQIATLNYGKALKAEIRVPGAFPVYGSSGEVGSHEEALVKGPGIVIGRKGNVGSVYWVNTDFYPIDTVYFISSEESSLFLYHALQNVQFINTDVAVPGLNRDMAYSREILVPDDKNHQRFLEEAQPIQNQINKLQDYNAKLAQARGLLLPKLMNGELVV